MAAFLFKPVPAGLAVSLRVTPNAGRAKIDGVANDADGRPFLKVAVTAVPEDGKANEAVIKLFAKEFHLPKSSFSIARRDIRLHAEDRFDLRFLRLFLEFPGGVHVPVVGDRQSGLLELLRAPNQVVDSIGTVEERVLGMAMQMNEGHPAKDNGRRGDGQRNPARSDFC